MKYIDFLAQTTLISLTAIVLFINAGQSDWPLAILGMQLLIGGWQLLSAFILLISKARFQKLRAIYLLISAVYLAILAGLVWFNIDGSLLLFVFTASAWSQAAFYYTLTCLTLFKKPSRKGSFLPHLGF